MMLVLLSIHVLAPQRAGPIALTQVFEPYLALTALIAAIIAFGTPTRAARPFAAVLVVVLIARCAPVAFSNPGPGTGDELRVMTWNIEFGPDQGQRALAAVLDSQAQLVALQELQPPGADALAADPTLAQRLPHRVLAPGASARGLGLMSTMTIVEHQTYTDPPVLRALVRPTTGVPFAVFVVHPLPARIRTFARIPVALETGKRDADIAFIRSLIDDDMAAGRDVLVLGDINTTEREPAYFDLTRGLRDAHLDTGIGPGFTWGPGQLASLPFGVLRIDYAFSSPGFVFESTFVDCSLPSDHCALEATLKLRRQDI